MGWGIGLSTLVLAILQEFWSPSGSIQNTIILLIEKIFIAMGDEIKVYLPRMVQPVLQLFMQDTSEQKLSTQKVREGGGGGVGGWRGGRESMNTVVHVCK